MCNPLWQSHSWRSILSSKNVPFCIVSQNPPEILANLSAGQSCWLVATSPLVCKLTAKIPTKVLLCIYSERVLQWANPRCTFPYSFTAISSLNGPCDVVSPYQASLRTVLFSSASLCLPGMPTKPNAPVHVNSVILTHFKHQLLCEVLPNSSLFLQHRLALVQQV